jgi:hypothetical protein
MGEEPSAGTTKPTGTRAISAAIALGVAVVLIVAALAVWDTLVYRGSVHLPRGIIK